MDKIVTYSFDDKGKKINFIIERLKPFEQFNLILKIISIIAKGNKENSDHVEQTLHNLFQTGKDLKGSEKVKNDAAPFKLVIDALKGALAELSDKDRDWLINELLKNTKIDRGNNYVVQATCDELDSLLSGFQAIFKLLSQLVKINLGFL